MGKEGGNCLTEMLIFPSQGQDLNLSLLGFNPVVLKKNFLSHFLLGQKENQKRLQGVFACLEDDIIPFCK